MFQKHIVEFRGADLKDPPQLFLEYISQGSLDRYNGLSEFESTQILCQLSSALEYLQNQNPSIAHRDIKPENILVVERTVNGIYVKFAGFGLSKAANTLKTCCGTPHWLAPEVYLNNEYSAAVDVWSLGAVVASLVCGLPRKRSELEQDHGKWTRAMKNHFKYEQARRDSQLLSVILDNMLLEDPDERSSIDYVHDEALKILAKFVKDKTDSDDGEVPSTSKPSIPSIQSTMASEKASTFRLDACSVLDDSRAPIRATVEDHNTGIKNDNVATRTVFEEDWEPQTASNPKAQVSQVDCKSLSPDSTVEECLWLPRDIKYVSKATEASNGESQNGRSQSIRKRSGPKLTSHQHVDPSPTGPLSANHQRPVSNGSPNLKKSKRTHNM
ncbi:MAG: hypothetical protein MMC23_009151 [Stictis urceolatum]|nr:hypothetical protein [Stictis urceolata]